METRSISARTTLVAHVIYRLDFGGLENGVVNLINGLPADQFDHVVVCLAGFNAEFRRRIRRDDVRVFSLEKRHGKDPGMYVRFWRLLRRLRPDIVHTRNLGTVDLQWIAWLAGVQGRIHGEHGWDARDPSGKVRKDLWIRRGCMPVIQRYVPMSRDIGHWLAAEVGVPPARIRQIYSGVDTFSFRPGRCGAPAVPGGSDRPIRDSGATGGAHERVVTFGTVGRLDPVKQQSLMLQALRSILDARPDLRDQVKLIIVGDGPAARDLRDLVRALRLESEVTLLGARSDIPALLRSMDVFMLTSLNEGISNTILEAMSSGLPVIASRVGGNPELVVDGVTGLTYPVDAPAELERAMLHYIDDPGSRATHGDAARARVVRDFSLDAMMARYADLYREMMASSGPRAAPVDRSHPDR